MKDSYVWNSHPNSNYGSSTSNNFWYWTSSSGRARSYIVLDITDLYSHGFINITKATLNLRLFNGYGDFSTGLYEVYNDWHSSVNGTILKENQITWNNQPCGVNFNSRYCNPIKVTSSAFTSFDITSLIQKAYNEGKTSVSIVLKEPTTANTRLNFGSKEAYDFLGPRGTYAPSLTIEYY